jgi:hypothetical protein
VDDAATIPDFSVVTLEKTMALFQILYDEKDELPVPQQREGLSFAVMALPTFYTEEELEDAITDLARKILRHHYGLSKRLRR